MSEANLRVYTGSGIGTIEQRDKGTVLVRLDDPRGGKLYRKFPEDETLPIDTWKDSEEKFRKEWKNKHRSFSWYNPETGNQGVMELGEIYDRLDILRNK